MNQRLQQFLAAENISQAQFADTIDVARASVSHVIAGRNNPGYDFIRSLALHYPELNLEWLICGKGKMYKSAPQTDIKSEAPASDSEAEEMQTEGILPLGNEEEHAEEPAESMADNSPAALQSPSGTSRRAITRVVIFYDDNTYQELK